MCVDCHCFSPSVYMMFLYLILSVWVTGHQVECSFKIHRVSVCVDCHCFSPPSVYMMFLCLILSVLVTGPQVECSFKIHRASVCVCGLPLFFSS